MKLFAVKLTVETVVWAEDEADALAVAAKEAQRDVRLAAASDARQIVTPEDVPENWLHSLPWGRLDETTVAELLGVKRRAAWASQS